MFKRLFLYQVIFWIFIFGKFFYYFQEVDLGQRIYITTMVVLFNMSILYLNFYVLIPRLIRQKVAFFGSQILTLGVFLGLYYITNVAVNIYGRFNQDVLLALVLNYTTYAIYGFLYWYVVRYTREKQRSLALQNEKLTLEMKALKAQVSPHFLFNSLNNIYSLCLNNPNDAADMIEKLSNQLRYLIYKGVLETVPLKDEINMIEDYVAIEQIKKNEGSITFDSNVTAPGTVEIMPLLLITLIENAFSHGDVSSNKNGFVKISLESDENSTVFCVENSFDVLYRPKKESQGIGLKNVADQLAIKHPDAHKLEITEDGNVYKVELKLWRK